MPPRKGKQNISNASNDAIPAATAAPTSSKQPLGEQHTPEREPSKPAPAGVTQAQKQILIDNLQQEVTDRARKLRAQYAFQAQGIRARLEIRVNRIPKAMLKRKMQDLVDEHTKKDEPKAAPLPIPMQMPTVVEPETRGPVDKSLKRQSDQITAADDDKENEPQDLPNPKKRTKTAMATSNVANTKATRTVSRKAIPSSTVLSPKSHNSRTLPRSPFKEAEKAATHSTRPASPIKAAQSRTGAAKTATRQAAASNRNARHEDSGRSSDASNTSAGTTIVTKMTAAAKGKVAAAKKAVTSGKGAAASKRTATATTATAKKENAPPTTAAAGRSLRKRA